jgi:hypothetical protein
MRLLISLEPQRGKIGETVEGTRNNPHPQSLRHTTSGMIHRLGCRAADREWPTAIAQGSRETAWPCGCATRMASQLSCVL